MWRRRSDLSDARNILEWFGKRKEDSMQAGTRKHGLAVLDVVSEVERAAEAMRAGDTRFTLKCIERMILSEKEADKLEDRISESLAGGEVSVQVREDLLRLARNTDKVANWATKSGVYIQMIIECNIPVPADVWDAVKTMATELTLATKLLIKAYENLVVDFNESIRAAVAVRDQEKVIDHIHYSTVKKILMSDMDHRGMTVMRDVVEALEESADSCKACAEILTILIKSRK